MARKSYVVPLVLLLGFCFYYSTLLTLEKYSAQTRSLENNYITSFRLFNSFTNNTQTGLFTTNFSFFNNNNDNNNSSSSSSMTIFKDAFFDIFDLSSFSESINETKHNEIHEADDGKQFNY
jgi:hypothetical protein